MIICLTFFAGLVYVLLDELTICHLTHLLYEPLREWKIYFNETAKISPRLPQEMIFLTAKMLSQTHAKLMTWSFVWTLSLQAHNIDNHHPLLGSVIVVLEIELMYFVYSGIIWAFTAHYPFHAQLTICGVRCHFQGETWLSR